MPAQGKWERKPGQEVVQQLRDARIAQGISGWALAKSLGHDREQIGRWELGRRFPSLDDLTKWADILGFDFECKFILVKRAEK